MNDKDSTSEKRTNPSVKSYPFSTLAKTKNLTMELRERIELGIRSKERREKNGARSKVFLSILYPMLLPSGLN